jgi:hypothetical protein
MAVNMGRPVNAQPATDVDQLCKGDDREPWISPGGNPIYFKSDRLATTSPRNNNDIFVTRMVSGKWTTPERVPAPISNDAGERALPDAAEGWQNALFRVRAARRIWQFRYLVRQQRAEGTWQEPVNQGANINTRSEFHFMEDRGGTWVDFTSTRRWRFGGADLSTRRAAWGQTSGAPP